MIILWLPTELKWILCTDMIAWSLQSYYADFYLL